MTVEFRSTLADPEALAGKSAGPGTTQEAAQGRIVAHLQANPRATRILLAQWLGRSDAGVKVHRAQADEARAYTTHRPCQGGSVQRSGLMPPSAPSRSMCIARPDWE
ncbi:MAG: hypothetical protein Q8M01_22285 [Rubrivivax sp.]|nr:hypothetical protein [Rubrivivax sp.]